jgi:tRNA/rRNA methyltransferase/tRNA (cytidine32/uridine32-2'-O)-methyltransferase
VSAPVRFVLIDTSHPGNIGAAARAMKNMSLEQLVLVRPALFPHAEATARASSAEDLLAGVRVEADLDAALRGCSLVLATSSRERDQYFRVLDARAGARAAVTAAEQGPVAILFGSERSGLTNSELESAHALVCIPANPAYPSLNLAMAVQIFAYELLQARLERADASMPASGPRQAPLATPEQMEEFFEHLATVLRQIDFRDRTPNGTHLMQRLRRLFQRAEPDENEINILRGILTAVQERRRRAGSPQQRWPDP